MEFGSHPKKLFENNAAVIRDRFPGAYATLMTIGPESAIRVEPLDTDHGESRYKVVTGGGMVCHMGGQPEIDQAVELAGNGKQPQGSDTLIRIGMGLGFGLLKLKELVNDLPHIMIFEPSAKMLHAVLHHIDLTELLALDKLELFVGEGIDIGGILQRRIFQLASGKVHLLRIPEYSRILGHAYIRFGDTVVEWIQTTRNIWQTMKGSGKRVLTNTIDNLPAIDSGLPLGEVRGIAAGIPAICIAAGPSLDEAYESLKHAGNQALLVACDSAVQGLLDHGVRPHVVVTTDMNTVNYEKIRPVVDQLRDTVLVFGAGANPDNVRGFPGSKRIVVSAENAILDHWILPRFKFDCRIPALTSVTHAALFSAMAMGADPIALVGIDLAYANGKSHANASVFEYTPDPIHEITVKGLDGNELPSTPQMIADKAQIESVLARIPKRVVNTSTVGAFIEGTESISLEAFVVKYTVPASRVRECLAQINGSPPSSVGVSDAVVSSMAETMAGLVRQCGQQHKRVKSILAAGRKKKLTPKLQRRITEAVSAYRQIEQHFARPIAILNTIRLGDIQSTRQKEMRLAAQKKSAHLLERILAEMGMLKEQYASLVHAGECVVDELKKVATYPHRLSQIMHDQALSDEQRCLDCAQIHAQFKELFAAERIYRQILASSRDDESAWTGLLSLYTTFRLWQLAERTARDAIRACPDSQRIEAASLSLSHEISQLKKKAQDLIDVQQRRGAMACLKEYLTIVSHDAEARNLYESLAS